MTQYREVDTGDVFTEEEIESFFSDDNAGLPEDKSEEISFGDWLEAIVDASRFEVVDED